MGKSSASQPKAPDPAKTAAAQTTSNVDTAIANAWLNSGNQVTPWGNVATNQIGSQTVGGSKVPIFSQTTTLSPEQQRLYEQGVYGDLKLNDLGISQIGRISDAVSSPFKLSQFGDQPVVDENYRNQIQQSLQQRLDPSIQRDREALDARLAAQGITLGSKAYDTAQTIQGKNINDARLGVIAQSGNEMAQQYGLANQSYQQRIANALLERQQPLQEFSQFTGASNNFQSPGAVQGGGGQVQPTDVSGLIYQNYAGKQNAANQATSQQNALYGAGAGLAGSALGGWASTW